MKNIINLNSNKTSAILALLIVSLIVLGCGGKPEMPSESASQSLVKTSLSDLADAVDKNDFKAFREKASADFQSSLTEDKVKEGFKTLVQNKEENVPVLRDAAGKNPTFSPAPTIREEKGNYILVTNGESVASNGKVKFENEYVWRDGAWKLLKISVVVS